MEIPPEEGSAAVAPPAAGEHEICPACHAEHDVSVGDFCEGCGYNFKTGVRPVSPPPGESIQAPEPVPAAARPTTSLLGSSSLPVTPPSNPVMSGWEVVIAVAPNPHAGMPDAEPPPAFTARVQSLDAGTLLIGRRSVRRQILPEISLDHDDGISHRHAQLGRTPEGNFSLSDLGSSNGTTLNGADVPPGVAIPLQEGDSVALGRWTQLTFRRQAAPGQAGIPSAPDLQPSV